MLSRKMIARNIILLCFLMLLNSLYTRKDGGRVERENTAQKLREYISKNQISISEMEEKTGVVRSKLYETSEENFNATEFLEICYFLKVDPRIFA